MKKKPYCSNSIVAKLAYDDIEKFCKTFIDSNILLFNTRIFYYFLDVIILHIAFYEDFGEK